MGGVPKFIKGNTTSEILFSADIIPDTWTHVSFRLYTFLYRLYLKKRISGALILDVNISANI